jgi:uncharacterized membrane protein
VTILVAVRFPQETTASAAAEEVRQLAPDILLEGDAIAVIECDGAGGFHVTTNHHVVEGDRTWGLFWPLLFSALFFVPALDMPVGAGIGPILRTIEQNGIGRRFSDRIRDLLRPGTSALFLAVDSAIPPETAEVFARFGGTVIETPFTRTAEASVQQALHGPAAGRAARNASPVVRRLSSGRDDRAGR